MSNSSIWPIGRTLSSASTPGQSEYGRNGNEGVLRILQISSSLFNVISRTFFFGWWSFSSAEMQSVYSTSLDDWIGLRVWFWAYLSSALSMLFFGVWIIKLLPSLLISVNCALLIEEIWLLIYRNEMASSSNERLFKSRTNLIGHSG